MLPNIRFPAKTNMFLAVIERALVILKEVIISYSEELPYAAVVYDGVNSVLKPCTRPELRS